MPYYYRVFSQAFEYPSAQQRSSLDKALHALAEVASVEDAEMLRGLCLDGDLETWEAQHNSLFGSGGQFHLALCFHLTENPFDQAKRLGEIAGTYRAFGLDAPEGRRHDELSLLLDFLGVLELKVDHALAQGNKEQADIAFKAAVLLMDEVVMPGLQVLVSKIETAGVGGYFPPLLKACLAAVELKMGVRLATV